MRPSVVGSAVAVALGWLLSVPERVGAQPFELLGARALGMGGAFTAVADDATAVYWNPAGLAVGPLGSAVLGRDLVGEHALPAELPARRHRATTVAFGSPSAGLAYYRLQFVRPVEGAAAGLRDRAVPTTGTLRAHQVALVLAHPVATPLFLGAALKLVRGTLTVPAIASAGTERVQVTGNTRYAWDVDLGFILRIGPARWGLVARNLRQPAFETRAGDRTRMARHVRTGVAVQAAPRLAVAADLDLDAPAVPGRQAAVGAELWLGARAAVRGGVRVSVQEAAMPLRPSLGASLGITRTLWLDGHWTDGRPAVPSSWGWALRVAF